MNLRVAALNKRRLRPIKKEMRVVRVLEDALHHTDNGGEGHVPMLGFDVTTIMVQPKLSRSDGGRRIHSRGPRFRLHDRGLKPTTRHLSPSTCEVAAGLEGETDTREPTE